MPILTLFRNTIPTTEKYEVYEKMELAEKLKGYSSFKTPEG